MTMGSPESFMKAAMQYGHIPTPPTPDKLYGGISKSDGIEGQSFSHTLTELINRGNDMMSKPEQLTIKMMEGDPNVDIHNVMIAMGQSEVAFKLMISVAQKVQEGTNKVMNMQV